MAESALCQVLLQNLVSLIQDEIGLMMGVDDEMKKLSSTFTAIQAVLQDAEDRKLGSKELQDWLCKLKDLTFEIEDILDECATHVGTMNLRNSKLSCCSLQNVMFRHDIGTRMKQLTKKLDAVAAEREKFGFTTMPAVENPREVYDGRATGSFLNESHQIYGRDKDQEEIVNVLVNGVKDNQQISVLPIIGVGGLGKTTLAQSIYKDQRVVEHFEIRLWVCVSDNFDQETLVRLIIESATKSGSASDIKQLDTLQHRLQELLNGKRYLLVLDDVWNEVQEKWFLLKNILSCGSNGASIVVTTRVQMVADIMGTLPPHCLKGLSEGNCWTLMKESAFAEEEREKYPNLEAIGKEIVKKCAGVPMAAKALGGLLRFKSRTEKEWNFVKESELWNLPEEKTLILPALRLSYHHLPPEFRQCFAYFAVFPKDYEVKQEDLINLWMAHGFISSKGSVEVEDVGNEICNELVIRSLFQHRWSKTIIMHDLVHDVAQSIMENKVPGVQVERQVISSTSNSKIREVNLSRKLTAFPTSTKCDMDISSILTKFRRLRVLDASSAGIKDLPSTVGNLKHLRFLNLSRSEIRTLPNSLCSLWNLKILNLDYCKMLVALPKDMRYLKNLCHLHTLGCESVEKMPTKIGELTSLKTLNLFIVGGDRGNELEELECLNLGGELTIKHLERVGSYLDAKRANLVEKKGLRDLILEWESNGASETRGDKDENVLEALQPHPNLQTLTIRGFSGRCFPLWMADSTLENVRDIVIEDCPHSLHLPQLGKLPHLKYLRLKNVGVEYLMIEDENAIFPSLVSLDLCSLPHLKGVSKEQFSTNVFPNLTYLMIDESCSSGTLLPQLSSVKELEISSIKMECLPEALRHLSSLDCLYLSNIPQLNTLPEWLDELTSLGSLVIYYCPKIVSLPTCIKGMPNLKCLVIEGCTEEGKRRWERGSGEEWHIISHIPQLNIL